MLAFFLCRFPPAQFRDRWLPRADQTWRLGFTLLNHHTNGEAPADVRSTGASGVINPQGRRPPNRPKFRTDEVLKKPKSKNYQDGKDKEDDRRNPIASGRSVCAHGPIPLRTSVTLPTEIAQLLGTGLSHRRSFSVMTASA
jgi:hypothetical protein